VDALRVARAGREQVEDEQVNAGVQQLDGLLDERAQAVPVGLVAGRDDLDDRHHVVAAAVADDDTVPFPGV
jgi:hypothetical protein